MAPRNTFLDFAIAGSEGQNVNRSFEPRKDGPELGTPVDIRVMRGRVTLGRGECEVKVADPSVSRVHAALIWQNGSLTIEDLQSRNGTYVNGRRISVSRIELGDVIQFATAVYVLQKHGLVSVQRITTDMSTAAKLNSSPDMRETIHIQPGQRRVLNLLLDGHSEKQIASRLGLSSHTVHNHIRHLYREFEVRSRAELLSRFVSRPHLESEV